ncbi:hypothetical protein SCHPADRAFT_408060 [Schizopora paradoxa]|uniref:Uncharacterized protein n=1 Tax=Schizopora paradoxa TaxID=27342 RepID=A0A0H2RKV6_9AGAM|nr:hypothetical protein SCHPADRAFT_408060 [Schizopora paradoxa]
MDAHFDGRHIPCTKMTEFASYSLFALVDQGLQLLPLRRCTSPSSRTTVEIFTSRETKIRDEITASQRLNSTLAISLACPKSKWVFLKPTPWTSLHSRTAPFQVARRPWTLPRDSHLPTRFGSGCCASILRTEASHKHPMRKRTHSTSCRYFNMLITPTLLSAAYPVSSVDALLMNSG